MLRKYEEHYWLFSGCNHTCRKKCAWDRWTLRFFWDFRSFRPCSGVRMHGKCTDRVQRGGHTRGWSHWHWALYEHSGHGKCLLNSRLLCDSNHHRYGHAGGNCRPCRGLHDQKQHQIRKCRIKAIPYRTGKLPLFLFRNVLGPYIIRRIKGILPFGFFNRMRDAQSFYIDFHLSRNTTRTIDLWVFPFASLPPVHALSQTGDKHPLAPAIPSGSPSVQFVHCLPPESGQHFQWSLDDEQ